MQSWLRFQLQIQTFLHVGPILSLSPCCPYVHKIQDYTNTNINANTNTNTERDGHVAPFNVPIPNNTQLFPQQVEEVQFKWGKRFEVAAETLDAVAACNNKAFCCTSQVWSSVRGSCVSYYWPLTEGKLALYILCQKLPKAQIHCRGGKAKD